MKHNNFAVCILAHGRPDFLPTLKLLKKANYNGKIYLILDDEDDTREQYRNKYSSDCEIYVFNKDEISKTFDLGDNFKKKNTVVFARNVCFKLAKEKGLEYFLELDDDYTTFQLKIPILDKFTTINITEDSDIDIEKVFDAYLDFLDSDKRIYSVAMSQGGDFIGGENHYYHQGLSRKCMNSFFCKTDRYFTFLGRINEDVNTYTNLQQRGMLFFSYTKQNLVQVETQQHKGGMTETYLDSGTYYKSFMSVIFTPSAVKIGVIHDRNNPRIHHRVCWNNCVPKILNEKFKKKK